MCVRVSEVYGVLCEDWWMMNRKCMKMIGSKENVNEKCKFMLHDGLWLIYENFAALAAHQFTIVMCVGILMH